MTDPLKFVTKWEFKELPANQSTGNETTSANEPKPLKEGPFRFNAYARPQKNFPSATPLYSDQPDIELKLFAYAPRHEQQKALASTSNLSSSQLGNWWEVAAAIYDITLQSKPAGDLQITFVQPVLPQNITAASLQDQPILGITPDQPLNQDDKRFQLIPSGVATRRLCLFNVVVACEWWPISMSYRRQLLWAFRRMSDFLYDVTDGYMALGSVAIGGYEWMNYADIQILASNRLHPRSWVSAMQLPEKFTPIRVGRGLWNKRNRRIMPWDEPEGYRTLVHEWAHYALGLKDRYLESVDVNLDNKKKSLELQANGPIILAVPTISLPLETIMAVLEGTSELVDSTNGPGKAEEWDSLGRRFPLLKIAKDHQINQGPGSLPLPLPQIQFVDLVADPTSESNPPSSPETPIDPTSESNPPSSPQSVRETELRFKPPIYSDAKTHVYPAVIDNHCWVFTIRGELTQPQDLIAHGTLDARSGSDGFALPGTAVGDTIVLIADGYEYQPDPSDKRGRPLVLANKLGPEDKGFFSLVNTWSLMTPALFPLTDVYPELNSRPSTPYQIEVAVDDNGWNGWAFSLGNRTSGVALQWPNSAGNTGSQSVVGTRGTLQMDAANPIIQGDQASAKERTGLPSLDGHILLTKNAGDPSEMQITIAAYSIGGGPKAANPPYTNPIPSGSSEGNALLFFYDETASTPNENDSDDVTMAVTTRNYGIPFTETGYEPCSYTYSFASNKPLVTNIHPTLVMFIDQDTVRKEGAIELRRYDSDEPSNLWKQAIPVLRKQDLSLIAAPLTQATDAANPAGAALVGTAPGLFTGSPTAERYRLINKPIDQKSA